MRMQTECLILTSKNLVKLKHFHAEFLEEIRYWMEMTLTLYCGHASQIIFTKISAYKYYFCEHETSKFMIPHQS